MMFLISLVAPEEESEPDKGPDGYWSELRDLPVFFSQRALTFMYYGLD